MRASTRSPMPATGPASRLLSRHEDAGRRARAPRPSSRAWRRTRRRRRGETISITVTGGQGAGPRQLAARAGDQPVIGHVAQQRLERDAVAALDAEGARDLALAGFAGRGGEKVEDVLLAREVCPRSLVRLARSPLRFSPRAPLSLPSLDGLFVALCAFLRAGFLAGFFLAGASCGGPLAARLAAISSTASSSVTSARARGPWGAWR